MNIWKKTNYKNLKKRNISYHAFNNLIWEKKILDKINLNKTFLKKNYSKFFLSSSPLPLILLEFKKKKIKIADYGSGDQEIFFQLLNSKIKGVKFFIDSIEVPKITKVLKKTIKKNIQKIFKLIFIINIISTKNMILFILVILFNTILIGRIS